MCPTRWRRLNMFREFSTEGVVFCAQLLFIFLIKLLRIREYAFLKIVLNFENWLIQTCYGLLSTPYQFGVNYNLSQYLHGGWVRDDPALTPMCSRCVQISRVLSKIWQILWYFADMARFNIILFYFFYRIMKIYTIRFIGMELQNTKEK